MNCLKKEFINKAVVWYAILFFCYSIIGRIVPLAALVEGPVNQALYMAFAGVGALLLFADLLTERYMFRTKYSYLLILFLVVTGLSCVVNIKYGITDNVKTLVWTSIQLLLLYTIYIRIGKEKTILLCKRLFNILIAVWMIAGIVSILQYMFQIGYYVELGELVKRQGFVDNRVFGVFNDPNYASVTSLYVIVMSLYLFRETDKKFLKSYYVVSLVVQYVYIILSGSRTAEVCVLLAIATGAILILKNYMLQKKWKEIKKVAIITVGVVVLLVLFVGTYRVSKRVLTYLPRIVMSEQGIDDAKKKTDDKKRLERKDVESDNISNNRATIWKGYMQSMEGSKNILGLSPRNSLSYISETYPKSYIAKTQYETHNAYLTVFVSNGVVGLLIVAIFGCIVAFRVVKKILGKKKIENSFICALIIEEILLVYAFFFSDLFFVNNLTTILFWILMGIVVEGTTEVFEKKRRMR